MARIFALHEPFLQSKAQLLVIPVSADGHILHPVIARSKSMFVDNYDSYHKKARAGELLLGDVLLHKIQKQHTGLGVQMGGAEYVAHIIAHQSPVQPISVRTFTKCLNNFKPHLYELMRYKGVRRVAILGSALLGSALLATQMDGHGMVEWLTADNIMSACNDVFADIPKITVGVHFSRTTALPITQKVLEN